MLLIMCRAVNQDHRQSQAKAADGEQLTLVWGDEASIGHKPRVEPHVETTVRVTVRTKAMR